MKKIVVILIALMSMNIQMHAGKEKIGGLVYYVNKDNMEASIIGVDGAGISSQLVIPSTVNDKKGKTYKVTSIGANAFTYNEVITSVKIPESIKVIADHAFAYCKKLKSVDIPAGVKIDKKAFYETTNVEELKTDSDIEGYIAWFRKLKKLSIGSHVTSVSAKAISCCNQLTDLYLDCQEVSVRNPNNFSYFDSTTAWFKGTPSIKHVVLGKNVKRINDRAFRDIELESIDASQAPIEYIGKEAFRNNKIEEIDLSKATVEVLSEEAFWLCRNLKKVILPKSLKEIQVGAFLKCQSLKEIVVPDNVTMIGNSAFSECTSLTSVVLPKSLVELGNYAFSKCEALKDITMPHVEKMGGTVFQDCKSLTSITLPSSIKSIGDYAFKGTSLQRASIPSSLSWSNAKLAFQGCTMLKTVTIRNADGTFKQDAEWSKMTETAYEKVRTESEKEARKWLGLDSSQSSDKTSQSAQNQVKNGINASNIHNYIVKSGNWENYNGMKRRSITFREISTNLTFSKTVYKDGNYYASDSGGLVSSGKYYKTYNDALVALYFEWYFLTWNNNRYYK